VTSRETAGSSSEASHARPGPLQQPAGVALLKPDVGGGHRFSLAGCMLLLALADELFGGGRELAADLGEVLRSAAKWSQP
jgi:hypothetical protein